MSSISMSLGAGSSRSRRRPDSMRCQARVRAGRLGAGWSRRPWRQLVSTFARCDGSARGLTPGSRGHLEPSLQLGAGAVAVAADEVIVDHAGRLHESIDRGRADEAEALRLQRLGDGLGGRRLGRHRLEARVPVDLRAAVEEAPQEAGKARALLQLQQRPRIVDGGLDLEPVAHDAGIGHQAGDVLGAVAGDARRLEVVEGAAEVLALPQDRQPRQARTGSPPAPASRTARGRRSWARPTPRRGSARRADRRCRPRGSAPARRARLGAHGASAARGRARDRSVAQSGLRSVIGDPARRQRPGPWPWPPRPDRAAAAPAPAGPRPSRPCRWRPRRP